MQPVSATGQSGPVRSRIPYRPVETIFFRPAGLEIFSIFSCIFGQFLQKTSVEILCSAWQTSFIDVYDKVDKEKRSILFISSQN